MATFLFDGDQLRECPYNSNHRVLSRRLLSHMTKCATEPSAPKLLICQYNSLHRLYPHEFNAHIVECPDNRQAIRELTTKVPEPSVNIQSDDPDHQQDTWTLGNGKSFVLKGLEGSEENGRDDGFISQHKLYGLKPAERKRIYNQMTENVIRRKAQNEREGLTEDEASEMGLSVQRPQFTIDTSGDLSVNVGASGSGINLHATTQVKRPVDEDEDEADNKEEVRKLIRSQADCFKSRENDD